MTFTQDIPKRNNMFYLKIHNSYNMYVSKMSRDNGNKKNKNCEIDLATEEEDEYLRIGWIVGADCNRWEIVGKLWSQQSIHAFITTSPGTTEDEYDDRPVTQRP